MTRTPAGSRRYKWAISEDAGYRKPGSQAEAYATKRARYIVPLREEAQKNGVEPPHSKTRRAISEDGPYNCKSIYRKDRSQAEAYATMQRNVINIVLPESQNRIYSHHAKRLIFLTNDYGLN